MSNVHYLISRLEGALEEQELNDGEHVSTPTVAYCFECDKIAVDTHRPEGCLEHRTVSSDGYEHAGIQDALTALRHVHLES